MIYQNGGSKLALKFFIYVFSFSAAIVVSTAFLISCGNDEKNEKTLQSSLNIKKEKLSTTSPISREQESKIYEALQTLTKSDNSKKIAEAVITLQEIGEPAVKFLINDMKNKYFPVYHYGALSEIGDSVNEEIIKATKDKDDTIRANAIYYLGRYGPKERIFDTIIPSLNDYNMQVRQGAVMGLFQSNNIKIIRPILAQMSPIFDSDFLTPQIMDACVVIESMDEIGIQELVRIIRQDENPDIRNTGKVVLKYIAAKKAYVEEQNK